VENFFHFARVGAVDRQGLLYATDSMNYDKQWRSFIALLVILDALAVAVSLSLAFVLRITSRIIVYTEPYDASLYAALTGISVVLWVGLFATYGLYKRDNLLGGNLEYQQAIKACTTGVVVLIVLSFFSHDMVENVVSRSWLFLSWLLSSIFVVGERFIARRAAYILRRQGWFTARVLIVGANDQGIAMAQQWQSGCTSGMKVIGFVDDFKPVGTDVLNGIKVVGRPTALADLVKKFAADEVVVVPPAVAWETFEEIIEQNTRPKGFSLRLSPGFYGLLSTSVAVTNKTFVPLFTINEARIVGVDAYMKSILDCGLSALLSLVALPVGLVIAALLKFGRWHEPVLARYHTMGQSGDTFDMYKFNIPIHEGGVADPAKVRWYDRVIYAKGLDKLPQFLNVLAGHMSLVGTQPTVVSDNEMDQRTACMMRAVKPGVLGPWLVREFWSSGEEAQDELYYVRNWTIWLDIQIVIQAMLVWLRSRRSISVPPPAAKSERSATMVKSPYGATPPKGNTTLPYSSRQNTSTALLSDWRSKESK
jgi:lipopolysaccharide/colanic/teichoic acid biosynthesis glycosyltransferase